MNNVNPNNKLGGLHRGTLMKKSIMRLKNSIKSFLGLKGTPFLLFLLCLNLLLILHLHRSESITKKYTQRKDSAKTRMMEKTKAYAAAKERYAPDAIGVGILVTSCDEEDPQRRKRAYTKEQILMSGLKSAGWLEDYPVLYRAHKDQDAAINQRKYAARRLDDVEDLVTPIKKAFRFCVGWLILVLIYFLKRNFPWKLRTSTSAMAQHENRGESLSETRLPRLRRLKDKIAYLFSLKGVPLLLCLLGVSFFMSSHLRSAQPILEKYRKYEDNANSRLEEEERRFSVIKKRDAPDAIAVGTAVTSADQADPVMHRIAKTTKRLFVQTGGEVLENIQEMNITTLSPTTIHMRKTPFKPAPMRTIGWLGQYPFFNMSLMRLENARERMLRAKRRYNDMAALVDPIRYFYRFSIAGMAVLLIFSMKGNLQATPGGRELLNRLRSQLSGHTVKKYLIAALLLSIATALAYKPAIKIWDQYKKHQVYRLVKAFSEYEHTRRTINSTEETRAIVRGRPNRAFTYEGPDSRMTSATGRVIMKASDILLRRERRSQAKLKRKVDWLQFITGVDLSTGAYLHDPVLLAHGYVSGYAGKGSSRTPYLYKMDFDAMKEYESAYPETDTQIILCRSKAEGFEGIPVRNDGDTKAFTQAISVIVDITAHENYCRDIMNNWPTITEHYRRFKAGEKGWAPDQVAHYRANKKHHLDLRACLRQEIADTVFHEEQHIKDNHLVGKITTSKMEYRAYLRGLEHHPLKTLEALESVLATPRKFESNKAAARQILSLFERQGLTRQQIHALAPDQVQKIAKGLEKHSENTRHGIEKTP